MIRRAELRGLAKSFVYAFRGIAYCIKNERNMRIHLSMVVLTSYLSRFYPLQRSEYLLMLLCFGLVIACEAVNTAIEALVNLGSPAYHPFARIAKDVAAGAVLAAAIAAAACGLFLFGRWDQLQAAFMRIFSSPLEIGLLLLLVILALLFIFNGPKLYGERTTRIYQIRNRKDS